MTRAHVVPARLFALALAAFAAPAFADEPISTDRPDFVESSATVGTGHWQLETSMAWERTRADGVGTTTWSTPTLLRIGAGERWELRVETDGWQHTDDGADVYGTVSGFSDLSLGVKYHIGMAGPGGASMAWLVHADLPSGAHALRGEGVRPSVRLAAEWELPHDNAIGVMPGIIHDTDDRGRRFDAGILAVTFGHAWSPRARTFVEVAGEQFASTKHGGNVVTFDTGATWLLSNDTQVDIAGSVGLTQAAPDTALTVGWSHRW